MKLKLGRNKNIRHKNLLDAAMPLVSKGNVEELIQNLFLSRALFVKSTINEKVLNKSENSLQ